jgi:hypothetical protein
MANGIECFLANYADRKVADDPVRTSIALLGATISNEWLPASRVLAEVMKLAAGDPGSFIRKPIEQRRQASWPGQNVEEVRERGVRW